MQRSDPRPRPGPLSYACRSRGSGICLSHPSAATGVRILTPLLHEMERRDVCHGLESLCIGGGEGLAAVFEWD